MPNGTALTHAKWAESTRCSACGRVPRLNRATTSSVRARSDSRSARTARQPSATRNAITPSSRKNHRNSCCDARGDGIGPAQLLQQAGALQEAVDVRPRRRYGEAAPAAQVEHGVEHHPAHDVAEPGGRDVDGVRRDADARARRAAG